MLNSDLSGQEPNITWVILLVHNWISISSQCWFTKVHFCYNPGSLEDFFDFFSNCSPFKTLDHKGSEIIDHDGMGPYCMQTFILQSCLMLFFKIHFLHWSLCQSSNPSALNIWFSFVPDQICISFLIQEDLLFYWTKTYVFPFTWPQKHYQW